MPARTAGKYGRHPRDFTRRALTFEDYLRPAADGGGLPPAPTGTVDRFTEVPSWPVFGNDEWGDCTCAAIGHMIQAWTLYAGAPECELTDAEVLGLYSAVSGFDPNAGPPGNNPTDNGAAMQDVLAYLHSTGIQDPSGHTHQVAGYAALRNPSDPATLKQVLAAFGTVYVGINCPASAQSEFQAGQAWTWEPSSPIEGGHAICLQRTNGGGFAVDTYVTWGAGQRATLGFNSHYIEEAWAVVTQDWIEASGDAPDGLDLDQLLSDMQYVE